MADNVRSFEHYLETQGLAQNNVNSIIQDSKGFIWMGTDDGLSRFDGYNFVNCDNDNSGNGLSNSSIRSLAESPSLNILWIGTQDGGLTSFNYKSKIFKKIKPFNKNYDISKSQISKIVDDTNHKCIYIGVLGKGLFRYYYNTNKIEDLEFCKGVRVEISELTIIDSKLFIGTEGNGVFVYNLNSNIYTNRLSHKNNGLSNDSISAVRFYCGKYYVSTAGGGINILLKNGSVFKMEQKINLGLFDDFIADISFHQDELWITNSNGEGLISYNLETKEINKYKNSPLFSGSISNDNLRCLCFDRSGKLWIATSGTGVDAMNPDYAKFTNLLIPTSDVRAFTFMPNQTLLIATYGNGLFVLNQQKKTINFKNNFENTSSLVSNYLQCFCKVNKDIVLIGSWEGMSIFDLTKSNFIQLSPYLSEGSKDRRMAVTSIEKLSNTDFYVPRASTA